MVELAEPTWPEFSGAVRGFVSRAPTGLGQPFEVMVPGFSADHSYQIRHWSARGLTVPALGDEVLVVEDDSGLPWVAAWWPAGGDVTVASKAEVEAAVVASRPTLILARAATTAALPTNTAPTTKTLEASANAALAAQDGVTLAVGDRLLVKNEATGSKNGAYEVTSLGAAGSKWLLTRIPSLDESAEVVGGMEIRILQGTAGAGTAWALTTTGAITLGTTALTFALVGKENPVNSTVEDLKIIRGIVNTTTPTIVKGAGFTLTRNGAGDLTISFSVAFSDIPSCEAMPGETNAALGCKASPTAAPTASAFRVIMFTTNGVILTDGVIHFTAIGPR